MDADNEEEEATDEKEGKDETDDKGGEEEKERKKDDDDGYWTDDEVSRAYSPRSATRSYRRHTSRAYDSTVRQQLLLGVDEESAKMFGRSAYATRASQWKARR